MNVYTTLVIAAVAALFFRALETAYFQLPQRELKRKAVVSKPDFRRLYQASKYPLAVRFFLGFLTLMCVTFCIIIASRELELLPALAVLTTLLILLKAFGSKKIILAHKIAVFLAPYLAKILKPLESLLKTLNSFIRRKHRKHPPTDLYEIEDLQDVIRVQQTAPNNRIGQAELDSALNALEFGGKTIKECMVSKSKVHFVSAKDPVGPILLSELHKTGFKAFPVKGNTEHQVDGMLYLENLVEHKEGGLVGQVMDPTVFYVKEDKSLDQVLAAYNKTGRQDFIVINEDEKVTGLVNLGDVLKVMTKHSHASDFADYDDLGEVAKH